MMKKIDKEKSNTKMKGPVVNEAFLTEKVVPDMLGFKPAQSIEVRFIQLLSQKCIFIYNFFNF
jgi:hypothetical protein